MRKSRTAGWPSLLLVAFCVGFLLLPQLSHAKSKKKKDEGPHWEARLSVEEAYTDNVRSASSGPQEEGAFFTTIKGRGAWFPTHSRWKSHERLWMPAELGLTVRGRVFSDFSNRNTAEIKPDVRYDIWRGSARLRYGYTPRRLRLEDLEGGDDVYYAEHKVEGAYELKFGPRKAAKVALGGVADWDDYRTAERQRNAFTPSVWGELRYRLHNYFVPRVKVKYGQRDARRDNYDRDELTVRTGFDSRLPMGVDLRFRYQYQNRDYTVDTPSDSLGSNTNFRRDDDLNQIEVKLGVAVPWVDGLSADVRVKLRDGDSTRTSRIFQVHELGFGLTYALAD